MRKAAMRGIAMRKALALGLAALLCLSSCGVIPSETGNGTAYDATAAETASYLTDRNYFERQ